MFFGDSLPEQTAGKNRSAATFCPLTFSTKETPQPSDGFNGFGHSLESFRWYPQPAVSKIAPGRLKRHSLSPALSVFQPMPSMPAGIACRMAGEQPSALSQLTEPYISRFEPTAKSSYEVNLCNLADSVPPRGGIRGVIFYNLQVSVKSTLLKF